MAPEVLWMRGGCANSPQSVAFNHAGDRVAVTFGDTSIKIWSTTDGLLKRTLTGHKHLVSHGQFSPDDSKFLSIDDGGEIRLWQTSNGQLLYSLSAHTGNMNIVAFSPDGNRFASGGSDLSVILWNMGDGSLIRHLNSHLSLISGLDFSANGEQLVSAGWDKQVNIWPSKGETPIPVAQFDVPSKPYSAAFAPSGLSVVLGVLGEIQFWDQSGVLERTLPGFDGRVSAIQFSGDGNALAAGDLNGVVKYWSPLDSSAVDVASAPPNPLGQFQHCVSLAPDGQTVAYLGDYRELTLWKAQSGTSRTLSLGTVSPKSATSTADGKLVAVASGGVITVMGAAEGEIVSQWRVPGSRPSGTTVVDLDGLSFNPSGNRLVGAMTDGWVRVWDPSTGAEERSFVPKPQSGDALSALAISPDGTMVASGGFGGRIYLNNYGTGALIHELQGPTAEIYSIRFAPDGKSLAWTSGDGTVRLWRLDGGVGSRIIATAVQSLSGISFHLDGKILATGTDGTVRFWSTADYSLLREIRVAYNVLGIAFAPDGDVISVVTGNVFQGVPSAVQFFSSRTGEVLSELANETHLGVEAVFSTDGRRIFLRRLDGSLVALRNPFVAAAAGPQLSLGVKSNPGELNLSLMGRPGVKYRIERTLGLEKGIWEELTTFTAKEVTTAIPVNVNGDKQQLFRAVSLP